MAAPFRIVAAAGLDPPRDAVLCLPRPGSRRFPVRSAWIESGYLQYVPNSRSVVAETAAARLRRLLVRFPEGRCLGLRAFAGGNVLFDFAVTDGPAAEGTDRLTEFLAAALRRAQGQNQPSPPAGGAAGLCVVRAPNADGDRLCVAKVATAASGTPARLVTRWSTPDGRPVPWETVRAWQNFRAVPFVEIEEIYIHEGVCSLQLKLRECIVHPPAAAPLHRPSAAFPGRRCDGSPAGTDGDAPAAKRSRTDGDAPAGTDGDAATVRTPLP